MKDDSKKETKVIASVLKALDVMELIAKEEEGLTVTEISTSLGYGTSATYHLLNTLRSRHYLTQDSVSKKYRIGIKPYLLFASTPKQNVISEIAVNYMTELTEKYDENCNLMFLIGNEVEYVTQTECNQMLRMFTQIGATVPFYCTGGGKAIFAFLPTAEQRRLLNETDFIKYTDNTLVSPSALLEDAADIVNRGIAFDREEREVGVFCIAAPIFSESGTPVAAISMSCPVSRLNDSRRKSIATSIKYAADKISSELKLATK